MAINDPNDPNNINHNHQHNDRGVHRDTVHGTSHVEPAHVPEKKSNLLPLLLGLLGLGLLALLLARGCSTDRADNTVTNAAVNDMATLGSATVNGVDNAAATTVSAFDRATFDAYLKGTDAVGRAYSLDKVTFATGSAKLDGGAAAELAAVAGVLKAYPNARVSVRGFADPAGNAAANQKLSADRAAAVVAALQKAGVSRTQVAAASAMGETGMTATRDNRRVELVVDAR